MKAQTFRVRIEDRDGLFVATSPDLKGMLVVGDSEESLKEAIPRKKWLTCTLCAESRLWSRNSMRAMEI